MSMQNLVSRIFRGPRLLLHNLPLSTIPQRLSSFRIPHSLRNFSASSQFEINRTQGAGGDSHVDTEKRKEDEFVDIPSDVSRGKSSGWKVSREGRVRNSFGVLSGREGRGRLSEQSGYYYYVNISRKHYAVHRIVALTFLAKEKREKEEKFPGEQLEVDHIDGDKQNNCVNNLQWLTRQEHVTKTAASQSYPRPSISSAVPVHATNIAAGEQHTFPSMTSLAKFLNTCTGGPLSLSRLRGNPDGVTLKGWRVRIDDEKFRVWNGEHFRQLFRVYGHEGRVSLVLDPPREEVNTKHCIEISNLGRVRFSNGRLSRGRAVKGYLHTKGSFVHRFVAEAFHPEQKKALVAAGAEESTLQVDHKDGNPFNNTEENLQWVDQKMHASLTWARIKNARKCITA